MKIGVFDHASGRIGGSQFVVACMARLLSQRYEVDLIHSGNGYTLSSLGAAFGLDLNRVNGRIVTTSPKSFSISTPREILDYLRHGWINDYRLTKPYDLFIYSGHGVPPFSHARQAIIYCHFPFETRPSSALQFSDRWQKRGTLDRGIRLAASELIWKPRMRGYAGVFANSHFTSGWIERLWGRPAEVIYPPVAVDVPAAEKRNVIVSVARFIKTDRKNHLQQLKAFPKFLGQVQDDWRLCLIGFCADIAQDRDYLDKLRDLAKDLPVTFVVNADRRTVLDHLAGAKLFWHSTGLRDEEGTAPSKMEHFGIATVEAMAAGCVPLVPAYGGQPEIVEHQVNGFTCKDINELVRHTVHLANADNLRAQMSRRAIERSHAFRPDVFEKDFGQRVFRYLGLGINVGAGHPQAESSLFKA